MSLTFPNSPSTNDTHVTGGSTWIFNGEMWVRQGTRGAQGLQGTQGTQGLQGLQGLQEILMESPMAKIPLWQWVF